MISNPIIYKFFKDFTNHKKKTNRAVVFSSIDLSPTFLNTGTTNENFQQSGRQYSFRHTLKSSASMYESSAHSSLEAPLGYRRSCHSEGFLRKGVLIICSKFTGEHSCRSVISIKLQSNFIEIALWDGCSPVNSLNTFS